MGFRCFAVVLNKFSVCLNYIFKQASMHEMNKQVLKDRCFQHLNI